MKLIKFSEANVTYAEDQPEYMPLPAYRRFNREGEIVCCWQFSLWERLKLAWTGRIWHSIFTFYKPLQPQLLTVDKPEMPTINPEWVKAEEA